MEVFQGRAAATSAEKTGEVAKGTATPVLMFCAVYFVIPLSYIESPPHKIWLIKYAVYMYNLFVRSTGSVT